MSGRLKKNNFTAWIQQNLQASGISPSAVRGYRVHSLKRGGVKIWKSVGRADEWIMKRMHATGFAAFLRYAFNNRGAWPDQVPQFSDTRSTQEFIDSLGISLLQFYLDEDERLNE